jgi:hypothetical protein
MTPAKSSSIITGLLFAILCTPLIAASIDLSTGPASWTVSIPVESVSNVTPFGNGGGDGTGLCLSSSCSSSGTWVTGANPTNFDGFWTAQLTFNIPAGATGVSLTFSGMSTDDRAVVYLNGTSFESLGLGGPGTGSMTLTDGGANNSYLFLSGNGASGTVASGFNIGGTNTLEAIINNTGSGISGSDRNVSGGDGTSFGSTLTLTYTAGSTTPEPGSMGLIAVGLALVGGLAARRRESRWSARNRKPSL